MRGLHRNVSVHDIVTSLQTLTTEELRLKQAEDEVVQLIKRRKQVELPPFNSNSIPPPPPFPPSPLSQLLSCSSIRLLYFCKLIYLKHHHRHFMLPLPPITFSAGNRKPSKNPVEGRPCRRAQQQTTHLSMCSPAVHTPQQVWQRRRQRHWHSSGSIDRK